jgi:hypothetical protein
MFASRKNSVVIEFRAAGELALLALLEERRARKPGFNRLELGLLPSNSALDDIGHEAGQALALLGGLDACTLQHGVVQGEGDIFHRVTRKLCARV